MSRFTHVVADAKRPGVPSLAGFNPRTVARWIFPVPSGATLPPYPNVRTELMALRDRGSGELEIEVEILQRFLAIKTSSLNPGQ